MSNPNWGKGKQGTQLHKQIEQYAEGEYDGAMTLEAYKRGQADSAPERREPRPNRKGRIG